MLLILDSSRRTIYIGLLGAVALHACLLLVRFEFDNVSSFPLEKSINVTLLKPIKPQLEKSRKDDIETTEQINEQVEEITETKEIEEEEIIDHQPIEDILVGAAIINSKEFKQLIIQDTLDYITNNPDSLEEFTRSFEIPLPEEVPDIEKVISPIGSGLYDTVRNGKVTCNLQVVMPFQNDFAPSSINTSRDCTPRKKFELNIK